MKNARNFWISLFVVLWTVLFHYESLRLFYLSPMGGKQFPKFPLLFPPAGWIMFYEVGNFFSTAEVYGVKKEGKPELVDPHRIMTPRFVGFDNIHRNVMVSLLEREKSREVCGYLKRKFPEYERLVVVYAEYPELVPAERRQKFEQPFYAC